MKTLAKNKRVSHDYFILQNYTAGIRLLGCETKAIIKGKVDLIDSFVKNINGEMWLVGCNVQADLESNDKQDTARFKKLLLHKNEIKKLSESMAKDGCTVMCSSLIISSDSHKNKIKAEIHLCKGKKLYQ